ncbi:MAG: hypothetical protein WC955_04915 [Elusimicrobiota bacterium]
MKKIKKFKLKLSQYYVERGLKKRVPGFDPDIAPDGVKDNIEGLVQQLEPAVVYETLPVKDVVKDFFQTTKIPKKAVAISFFIYNFGRNELKLTSSDAIPQEISEKVFVDTVIEEANKLSSTFIINLLKEEAKKDDCNLAEPVYVLDKVFEEYINDMLNGEKIGVELGSCAGANLAGLTFGYIYWLSKSKGKQSK